MQLEWRCSRAVCFSHHRRRPADTCACDLYPSQCCYCKYAWFVGWLCTYVGPNRTGHCRCSDTGGSCNEWGIECGTIEPPPTSIAATTDTDTRVYSTCGLPGTANKARVALIR